MEINASEATCRLIAGRLRCEKVAGELPVKGAAPMSMYWIRGA